MPKPKKQDRRLAATLRVASVNPALPAEDLRRMGSLLVVQGAEVDLGKHMLCDHPIIIGRDERIDFSLNDGSISRAHCSVERAPDEEQYMLVDLDSTNGTTLNGKTVQDRVLLEGGDKIFLGSSVLRFSFSDSVDIKYHSKVEELVQTDALTGLDAKRQYDAIFHSLSEHAQNNNGRLTVFVIDLDDLKAINDTHGHEMGSYAIVETAKIMRSILLEYGHLARFGGDEFVCCFPDIDHEKALFLAQSFRATVASHPFQVDDIRIQPTICVGIATYPEHTDDVMQLFKKADDALYRAKRAGKNLVESATSIPDQSPNDKP